MKNNCSYDAIMQMHNCLTMRVLSIESALDLLSANNPDYLVSPKDVSKLLGVSRSNIYRLLKKKQLKGFKINKHWNIKLSYVDEYIRFYILSSMGKTIFPVLIKKRGNIKP